MAKNKKKFNPDVSVIISMYNAEDYVAECLQSLLDQTLENIEVVVVDDCSTDNSVAVVKSFMPKFEGRLILNKTKTNSGYPGFPRNMALNLAHGKYIYFLDSDDFIDSTALEDFFKVAEEFQADVVHSERFFEYKQIDGAYKDFVNSFQQGGFVETPTLETSDIGERVNKFINKNFLWWGCNKLFRRDFLLENKIKFPDTTSFEDYVFVFQCIIAAKNYVRVPFASYHYRIRTDSLSHKLRTTMEVIKNMAVAVSTMDNFMLGRKFFIDNPEYRYDVIDFFAQWRMDAMFDKIFYAGGPSLPEIYALFYQHSFSDKKNDSAALTSYLFVAENIYKMHTRNLENQIADLKNQLAEIQNQT